MINTYKGIFIIIFISLLLPMLASYYDTKIISILPAILLLIFLLLQLIFLDIKLILPYILIWPLIIASMSAITSSLLGKITHFGFLLVMIQVFLMYFIIQTNNKIDVKQIYEYIYNIFLIIICIILLEWIFILTRNQDVLVSIFNSENVTKYKNYNSATFLEFITNDGGYTGANGPTLGSQGLSQLLLFAIFYLNPYINRKYTLIAFLLILLYIFSATMTTTLFLFFLTLYSFLMYLKKRLTFYKILFVIFIIYYFEQLISIVFFRLNKFDDIYEYYDAYFRFDELINIDLISLLFGLNDGNIYSGSDFGFLSIILSGGSIYFVSFLCLQFYVCILGYKCYKVAFNQFNKKELFDWALIGFISSIASLMFFWGLIHYTPSIELGGSQVYSLCITLTFVAYEKINNSKILYNI